jgi:putative cell wall-binding protein
MEENAQIQRISIKNQSKTVREKGKTMGIRSRKIFRACLLVGFFIVIQLAFTLPNQAEASFNRLAGADRYQTAVAISQKGWEKSDYVILVNGYKFADALCAGPLAVKDNAPLLFIENSSINTYTLNEIRRLEAKTAILIGEYGSVSDSLDQILYSAGVNTIEKIYGYDSYETSVEIAKRLGSKDVALATANQYADALSIASVAAAKGFAILLTPPDSLPAVVKQHLNNYKIEHTYLIGGTEAISKEVESQVPSPVRLAGNDRYDTNRLILNKFAADLDFNKIYAATGEGENGYADSLAGVVLAGKTASPIVLNGQTLAKPTRDFVQSKMTVATYMIALGGEEAVPDQVVSDYNDSLAKVRKSVFNQRGNYGPSAGTSTIAGSLAVEAPDITVQNTTIEGDLLLGEGIGSGTVELDNVTVKGRTTIRGGGMYSIIGNNFTSKLTVIDVPDEGKVAFRLKGKSKVDNLTVETNAIIDDSGITSSDGFKDIAIIRGDDITLDGNFNTVSVAAGGATVKLDAVKIKTYNAKSRQTVTGSGTVSTANVSGSGVEFYLPPAVTNVDKGLQAYVAGKIITEGTSKGSSGTSTSPAKATTPISDLSALAGSGQVTLTFTLPTDATNVILQQSADSGATWSSIRSFYTEDNVTNPVSYTVAGLINGQTYEYKLVVSGGSRAGTSNIASATPGQPIDLTGTAGYRQVTLFFSPPTGANSVVLQQSTDDGTTWAIAATPVLTATSTTVTVSGLSSGQAYQFKLVVVGGPRSGESAVVRVTPY